MHYKQLANCLSTNTIPDCPAAILAGDSKADESLEKDFDTGPSKHRPRTQPLRDGRAIARRELHFTILGGQPDSKPPPTLTNLVC